MRHFSENKLNIYIYVEGLLNFDLQNIWKNQKYNPGIGGTTFQQLSLIRELRKYKSEFTTLYVIFEKETRYQVFDDIKTISFDELELNLDLSVNNCLIINSGGLESHFEQIKRITFNKVINWLHHPFDSQKCRLGNRINALNISNGNYAYFSNILYSGRHSHILNFFYTEHFKKIQNEELFLKRIQFPNKGEIRFGYMGNLHSSKGFHVVAKYWKQIKKIAFKYNLRPSLHVIGGNVYLKRGYKFLTELPTENNYANFVLKQFDNNMKIPSDVFFYGVLENPFEILQSLDICCVNPIGVGETASSTILELYTLGIPVITSSRYGLSDYARYSPELTIRKNNQLPKAFERWLKMELDKRKSFLNRQFLIASMREGENKASANKWLNLASDYDDQPFYLSPVPPMRDLASILKIIFLDKFLKPIKALVIKKINNLLE